MPKKNLLDTLLDIGKKVTKKIIITLEPIFGFNTEIYYPLSEQSESMYESDDNKYLYNSTPDFTGRHIAINFFDEDFFLGDLTYDPFPSSQAYILTHGDKVIPLYSLVLVYKGKSHYKGRVVDHKVFNGSDGAMYIKNMISPYS